MLPPCRTSPRNNPARMANLQQCVAPRTQWQYAGGESAEARACSAATGAVRNLINPPEDRVVSLRSAPPFYQRVLVPYHGASISDGFMDTLIDTAFRGLARE